MNIPLELYYPIFAGTLFTFVIFFIPKANFKSLFWISLFWGFFICHIFIILFGSLFKLFQWTHAYPFVFINAPLFIKTAWLFAMMVYFYFLPQKTAWYVFPLYLIMFSFVGAALDAIFNQIGLLKYIHWNPFYRFLAALVWNYFAALHYRSTYPKD